MAIYSSRMTGRTTRMIDECIQELFKGEKISVIDHHSSNTSCDNMFSRIMGRISFEHNLVYNKYLEVKTGKRPYTISIKPEYFKYRQDIIEESMR